MIKSLEIEITDEEKYPDHDRHIVEGNALAVFVSEHVTCLAQDEIVELCVEKYCAEHYEWQERSFVGFFEKSIMENEADLSHYSTRFTAYINDTEIGGDNGYESDAQRNA